MCISTESRILRYSLVHSKENGGDLVIAANKRFPSNATNKEIYGNIKKQVERKEEIVQVPSDNVFNVAGISEDVTRSER